MPLLQRETPTLGKRIYELLKELIQEILLYIMKFKAWLTPGTADDQAVAAAAEAEDAGDTLKAMKRKVF